jgi:hypothetical protein
MHLYRQSIIIFGLIVPIFIGAAVVGLGFVLKSKVTASFANKESKFKSHEQARRSAMEIESQVVRSRDHLVRWNGILSEETASSVASHLREITEKLPAKEIQQTAFERPGGKGGFGNATAQDSSQIRMAYRGTFRTLQRAFLELETRMPNLQLQELRLDPSSNQSSMISLQATYTAWEN